MCGFVGVFDPSGTQPQTAEALTALLRFVRHRGPDQSGVHTGTHYGVAACRLAIRGGTEGDQPLVSDDGHTVVAFNGELSGWARDASDTRSLSERSVGAPAVLEMGMGALATYHAHAQTLTLEADGAGIKPLYRLTRPDGTIWFASELAPLLAAFPAAREVSLAGLAELLHYQRPRTCLPFDGPVRVAGCETHTAEPFVYLAAPDQAASAERDPVATDPVAAVRAAWSASAAEAANVAGPVCLFLSGGLDSAAVAAWAGRDDLLCLTGRFAPAGGDLDESEGAAAVAAAHGLQHEVVDLRDADLIHDLPAVVRALEVPMMGPGSLALWQMAKRARAHGKVVLTGTGGDELLGGYARTALALGRAGPWTRGYEGLRARIESAGADPLHRVQAAFARFDDLQPVLSESFLRALPAPAPIGVDGTLLDALLREEREGTLRGLLHVEDRVLSAHGLEGRPVPVLGGLGALATTLPESWLIGPDGEGKRALRAALKGVIPERVRTDPRKRGFPTPFARAARGVGRDWVLDLMHDQRFLERGWWNVDACRALLDEPRPVYDRALWAVCTWETWARLFLDGDVFAEDAPSA